MSKNEFILEAKARTDVGKGASRRLRRLAGEIPAIIYGAGEEPASITVRHDDILHATENEAFFTHILELNVDGNKESVIIKDLQRHPAKPLIMHADFQRVKADQELHVNIPLHFINEEKCIGVRQEEGQISHLMNELEVMCLPKDLPEYIEVDVGDMHLGDAIHISDLALPEGVSSVSLTHGEENDLAIVQVVKLKTREEEPEETEEAAAPESEGEEGEGEGSSEDEDTED